MPPFFGVVVVPLSTCLLSGGTGIPVEERVVERGGEHMAESTAGNAVCSMAESATGTIVGSRGREAHHAARCISAWSP